MRGMADFCGNIDIVFSLREEDNLTMINGSFGWRGKIGLILRAGQIITEPLYNLVAPAGVSFYASRILGTGSGNELEASLEREAFRAGKELAAAQVDCIAYCCTASGIAMGMEGDKKFCRRMSEETGILTTSSLSAVLEALETLNLKKIVLISPYEEKTHHEEEQFFSNYGFNIVKSRSMESLLKTQARYTPPGEILQFCRESWDVKADGIFISCMNFDGMPCIAPLEEQLGTTVISSHSATLWKALQMINIGEPVRGYGRLLAECI